MNIHSTTPFLNSLLLEVESVDLHSLPTKIEKFSQVGRHQYSSPLTKENIQKLCFKLAEQFGTTKEDVIAFLERVQSSDSNIESILKMRSDLKEKMTSKLSFIEAEQLLYSGHTFHPTPKARDGFSEEDLNKYSPEFNTAFPIHWFLVSKSLYFEQSSAFFEDSDWLLRIFSVEHPDKSIPVDYIPFPLHPWQKKHLGIKKYLESKKIIDLGEGKLKWSPTSSLRTLYNQEAPYMLKFSMNVKLTNSVRHLLVHELVRGLQVHEVFNHKKGKEFSLSHPYFQVIHEPVFAGIKDLSGEVMIESLVLGRHNPFKKDSESIVLATLTQDHPDFDKNILHRQIEKLAARREISLRDSSLEWFKHFLNIALEPLIDAQSDYGILLGSHQQNMIIELVDGTPVRSYFRDCNGTGYSKLGHETFKSIHLIHESNGNILDEAPANYLFGYYIIINSTFNVIASIAHSCWISEQDLLDEYKIFLNGLRNKNPKDSSFINYLLQEKFLMHKGNFLCSFKHINENTEKNPLSIYTKIRNPIVKENL